MVIALGIVIGLTVADVGWAGDETEQGEQEEDQEDWDAAYEPPRPAPLVQFDRAASQHLVEAHSQVAAGRLDEAIELLQDLVSSDTASFHRYLDDANRHVAVHRTAEAAIAALPREGRRRYARRYEAAARRLLEMGRESDRPRLLYRAAREYFHTPSGRAAADELARLAYAEGRGLEAGYWWLRLAEAPGTGAEGGGGGGDGGDGADDAAAWHLSRAALAFHAAAWPSRAEAALERLKAAHEGARGPIGGQEVDLAAFVQRALEAGAVEPPRPKRAAESSWLSMAGGADGRAVMPPFEPAPVAVWSSAASGHVAAADAMLGGYESEHGLGELQVRDGRMVVTRPRPSRPPQGIELPAMVHQVIVDGLAIHRQRDRIVATDPHTGGEVWSFDLPLFEPLEGGGLGTGNPLMPLAGDMGRHTVSYADGVVFATGRYGGIDPDAFRRYGLAEHGQGSVLAAINVTGTSPRLRWQVGRGEGSHEELHRATWLGAPTVHRGRLYALAILAHSFTVVCLDGDDGALLWRRTIGPLPTAGTDTVAWQAAYATKLLTQRASPPAVDDDSVYLTTNLGLVVALEAASGRPRWTWQYDSAMVGRAGARHVRAVTNHAFILPLMQSPLPPVNPVVVSDGRVIVLPCDSDSVLALDGHSGELIWQAQRDDHQHLSWVDDTRVLLSEPGLRLLRVGDGSTLHNVDADVAGRPAVTAGQVIASGRGELVWLDLSTLEKRREPVEPADALLGNLVSIDRMLVASNLAGISVYRGLDDALDALAARLAGAEDARERFDPRLRQVELLMRGGRLDAAAEAVGPLEAEAQAVGGDAIDTVKQLRLRLLLARAGESDRFRSVMRLLDEAAELVAGDAPAEAMVMLERVRQLERLGRIEPAVETAQRLNEQYRATLLPAQSVTAPGDEVSRLGGNAAAAEVVRLLETHGQEAYARLERASRRPLRQGVRRGDARAVLEAAERWSHAGESFDSLLAAAARLLAEHRQGDAASADDALRAALARRLVAQASAIASPSQREAALGAWLKIELTWRPWRAEAVAAWLDDLRDEVEFELGGEAVSLGELRRAVRPSSALADWPEDAAAGGGLPRALWPQWSETASRPYLVADPRGRPLERAGMVWVGKDSRIACIEPLRGPGEDAARWVTSLPTPPGVRLSGHLTPDGRWLALLDPQRLMVLDAVDGTVHIERPLSQLEVAAYNRVIAAEDRLVFFGGRGRVTGVDIPTARVVWQDAFGHFQPNRAMYEAGVVAVIHGRGNNVVTCLDLWTGEHLLSVNGRSHLAAGLNRDGLLLTQVSDHTLRVHDPRQTGSGAIAQVRREGDHARMDIVALGRRFALVRSREDRRVWQVIDLAAPGEARPVDLPDRERLVWSAMAGETALLLLADDHDAGRARPVLVACDLNDAAVRWSVSLEAEAGFDGPVALTGLRYVDGIVAMTITSRGGARSGQRRALMIDATEGRASTLQSMVDVPLDVDALLGEATPAMTVGGLLLDTPRRLTFFRSDPP